MNEAAVLSALKNLITDNEQFLCRGLFYQGQAKRFQRVTTTNLTAPDGYTHILIFCMNGDETSQPTAATTTKAPSRRAVYSIRLEITDQGEWREGEDNAYEESHLDHRKLCDRIAALIEGETWIGTAPKLELLRDQGRAADRAIRRQDLSGVWRDTANNWWATLHTQLNFTLIEGCVSHALLYE